MIMGLPKWINWLSIDVALGTALLSVAIAKEAGQSPEPMPYLLLGFFVWIIYTFDHLFGPQSHAYERHRFQQRYRGFFKVIFYLSLPLCLVAALVFLDFYEWLTAGISLFILGNYYLMYFLSRHFRMTFMSKELIIALGFTAGVLTLPLGQKADALSLDTLPAGAVVFGLACLNLLLLSMYEQWRPVPTDEAPSGGWLSGAWRGPWFWIIGALVFALTSVGWWLGWFRPVFCGSVWLFLLGAFVMFLFPDVFKKAEGYRRWVDALFCLFLWPVWV